MRRALLVGKKVIGTTDRNPTRKVMDLSDQLVLVTSPREQNLTTYLHEVKSKGYIP